MIWVVKITSHLPLRFQRKKIKLKILQNMLYIIRGKVRLPLSPACMFLEDTTSRPLGACCLLLITYAYFSYESI